MTLSGTVDIVQFGIQSPVTIMKKAPDQRLTRSTIMGNDTTSVCSNGTCWERTENEGVEKIEGAELERWLEDADYDRFANIEDYAQSIETTELAEISGTEVYEVKLIDHHGNENFYYFDSDTALLARASLTVADQGGFQPRTVSYSDYETFGDFTLPTRTIEERQDTAVVTHIEEVSFAEIPDSEFAMPEELQSES